VCAWVQWFLYKHEMNKITWQTPPAKLHLDANAVHVWRYCLNEWSADTAVLSAAEQRRGQRFLREEHRRQFCMARAYLRIILAKYLSLAPAQIQFREGPHGKLYLLDHQPPLQFNLSHSGDLALYAVTLADEVGIDVEWMNPEIEISPLMARFYTPAECQSITEMPPEQQKPAFYQVWTRKEAYLKALGLGLSGLSQTLVQEPSLMVQDINPARDYAGAIALTNRSNRHNLPITYFRY
jgi:4'-phosphopantetheinyl transferase